MSKKPAPPPGLSGRPRPHEGDVAVSSNSSLLLAGLDGVRSKESSPQVSPLHPQSPSAAVKSADLPADKSAAASTPTIALGVPPLAINTEGSANGLLLSPRAQMRKANISSLQLRDAPPAAPNKRSPTGATPAPIAFPEKAKSPADFSHAIRVLSNAYDEILSTLSDIEEELVNIKDTTELRERKATIRLVVTIKQILDPVPLVSKERRETRVSNHSKEVLLLVFYKNTEDSLWIIRQKLAHLLHALQSGPNHTTLVNVGHLFRSISQTLAMYDAKLTGKLKTEKGDRPKSADLSQQVVKMPQSAPMTKSPSMPPSPSGNVGHSISGSMIDRSSSPSPLSPTPPLHLGATKIVQKQGRISSVTLVPRTALSPSSPSRPLIPPPPSDFEIYKDEQGDDLIRAGTYSSLVYLLTHPDFEQGIAGIQAFVLVHRYQHSPGTLFNILETIYDEVVLRKFAEGSATATLLAQFFCVWIEFALMPEFLINRRTIPSWPLSLYDRLLLFLQKLERNGQTEDANTVKLTCLRSFHHYHHLKRVRRLERRRLGHRHAFVVPSSFLDSGSTDSSSSSNVERIVKSLDRQLQITGAPLGPSTSTENLSVMQFIRSGVSPYPQNSILSRLSPQAMAEQLTIKETLLFRRITDREFVTYKTKAQPKVSFIAHMVTWFNIFSHAVAGEVLSCTQPDLRAELIGRFIDTGVILKSHGNYNGVMEILAAMNILAVSRLAKTWQLVNQEKVVAFKELEALMDSRSNFQNYRRDFAAGTVKLPYMGIFSRDCVFLNEANADLTLSQLWNWEKILLKGKQVYLYKRLQYESMLVYPEIEDVQVAFNGLQCPDVDDLYNMSLHLEPRKDDPLLVLS